MSLSERLDEIRAGAAKQIPEPAREVMQRATRALEDSGLAQRIVGVGAKLPPFTLHNQYGDTVNSADLLRQGPLVLTLYRGLW